MITFNGVSSDSKKVIVERIPNRYVPARRFKPQSVAGKNGDVLLVDKSFPNVEQEYEVYLSAEAVGLPSIAKGAAEWLCAPVDYAELTDDYDTTVYREALHDLVFLQTAKISADRHQRGHGGGRGHDHKPNAI